MEWVEYYDETYQHKYFVNTRTNESAWEIPSKDGTRAPVHVLTPAWFMHVSVLVLTPLPT